MGGQSAPSGGGKSGGGGAPNVGNVGNKPISSGGKGGGGGGAPTPQIGNVKGGVKGAANAIPKMNPLGSGGKSFIPSIANKLQAPNVGGGMKPPAIGGGGPIGKNFLQGFNPKSVPGGPPVGWRPKSLGQISTEMNLMLKQDNVQNLLKNNNHFKKLYENLPQPLQHKLLKTTTLMEPKIRRDIKGIGEGTDETVDQPRHRTKMDPASQPFGEPGHQFDSLPRSRSQQPTLGGQQEQDAMAAFKGVTDGPVAKIPSVQAPSGGIQPLQAPTIGSQGNVQYDPSMGDIKMPEGFSPLQLHKLGQQSQIAPMMGIDKTKQLQSVLGDLGQGRPLNIAKPDTTQGFSSRPTGNIADALQNTMGPGGTVNLMANKGQTDIDFRGEGLLKEPQANLHPKWGSIFQKVGNKFGVNPKLLDSMAKVESRYNPDIKSSLSSAGGMFQFLDKTWEEFIPKLKEMGLSTSKFDPVSSATAAAMYMKKNLNYLKKHVGNNLPKSAPYIAHNLGPGGAKKLLSADPFMKVNEVLPSKVLQNNPLFFKGNPTVGEAINRYNHHLGF